MKDAVRNSWGFSLFCDDLRNEVGGKLSIMGTYQADMIFPESLSFPLAVAKFCILVKYYEVKDHFRDDLELLIFMPGDAKDSPSLKMPFPRESLIAPQAEPLPLEDDQERVFNVTIPVGFSPFSIRQDGYVKVRMAGKNRITNLGSLLVRRPRPGENLTFA